ncbi:MAG: DAK2 domain-containing protein [Erysipelotrichales bacterium]|nr:DAK2 domain-containing protein [Erysipelotrichales bacterium]MBQ4010924.1 DAK2 domain-containing protein [Erysipelotrichales bacterium]MBQ4374815.1 DAK2 domain-containing protein [Erysipelotrichales bacterium]
MKKMNGKDLKILIESAGNNLANHHHHIDALNVFPVPDGDTGTNMHLTFTSGREQVKEMKSESFGDVAKVFSRGLLMGARGNSGVILSQVFRGFAQSTDKKVEITAKDLAAAFMRGTEVAYRAIMKPVEGTILTVVRESSAAANEMVEKNPEATIEEFFEVLVQEAEESLKRTPDLLPVLKEVGVLDSGGSGFVEVIRGFKEAVNGHPVELAEENEEDTETEEEKEVGYRTQIHLMEDRLSKEDNDKVEKLRMKLELLGENLIVREEAGRLLVSINTLMPGQVLNAVQRYGTFEKVQIENLAGELGESIVEDVNLEPLEYAIIAVSSGEGLNSMFKDLGATHIVTGGQTMNPSTESFCQMIEKVKANHILILPNNSNIILAAEQTKDVLPEEDIHVIPTKSIPQGLSALIAFDPEGELEDNLDAMKEAAEHVVSGSVTYSIKDTSIDGVEIKAGDYMGIMDKKIVLSTPMAYKSAKGLVDAMAQDREDEYSVFTLIGGEGVNDSDLELLKHYINKKYPDFEVETYLGEQPVYSYFIGLD